MAEYTIDKIEYGGNVYKLQDNISGYTKNTGTITKVQTTAGAHTTINVSSGAATFNVPTKTSHLTNDSGFLTSVANDSHNHSPDTIYIPTNYARTGSLDLFSATKIGSYMSNKSFAIPPEAITIEYSTDGGSTWQDYGATDLHKRGLFAETRNNCNTFLGKATTKEANSLNNQLRITISRINLGRYTAINSFYTWMTTNGNTVYCKLERSLNSSPTVFETVFTDFKLAGWSGHNIRYFPAMAFGGGNDNQPYAIRLTVWQTAITTNYPSANLYDIRFYGPDTYSASAPYYKVQTNELYTWDNALNAIFPAGITATSFSGNLTGNVTGNVSGTATNVTGTVAIANGGTGQTTAANAINALLNGLPVWTADPTDTTYFVRQDTGGSATYGKVAFSTIWNYISGKLPAWSKASTKPSYNFSEIGSTPTTLSGYGITDAKIASGTITLGSNTITPLTSSSTLDATKLSGTIPSSCYTDSDEKVKSVVNTDSATCYLLTTTKSTENTGTAVKHTTAKVQFSADSSTNGYTILLLGNDISKDTAGAKYGVVRLYGNSTYYTDLQVINASTANRTIKLPDANGTLVLTDNLPTISLNGSTTTSPSFYAPTTAGTNGYVLKSNGSGAPTWTSATLTDEKVQTIAASNNTTYYLMLADGANTKIRQIDSIGNGLKYNFTQGTTTTVGTATLLLGNLVASGNDYNTKGILRLHGTNARWIDLISGTPTATRTITLPDKDGTLATTDLANASNRGLMSNTDKIYLNGLSDAIGTTSSTITIKNGSSGGRAFYLETSSSDTDDTSLISAITSLGWDSDVIVS